MVSFPRGGACRPMWRLTIGLAGLGRHPQRPAPPPERTCRTFRTFGPPRGRNTRPHPLLLARSTPRRPASRLSAASVRRGCVGAGRVPQAAAAPEPDAEARVAAAMAQRGRALLRVANQWSLCHDDALDAYQRALEIY